MSETIADPAVAAENVSASLEAGPMVPSFAPIRKVTWETDDTFTLLIDNPGTNGNGFSLLPGQFNMVYAFGIGECAISISSNPNKPNMLAHTIHRIGTVTSALSKMKPYSLPLSS